jgi:hypothetical protein
VKPLIPIDDRSISRKDIRRGRNITLTLSSYRSGYRNEKAPIEHPLKVVSESSKVLSGIGTYDE